MTQTPHAFSIIQLQDIDGNQFGQYSVNDPFNSYTGVVFLGGRAYRRVEAGIYRETYPFDASQDQHIGCPSVSLIGMLGGVVKRAEIPLGIKPWVITLEDRVFLTKDFAGYYETLTWDLDDQDPAVELARSIAAAAADSPCDCDCDCDRLDDIKDLISKLHSEIGDRLTNIHADICDANSALDDIAIDLSTHTPPTFPDSEPLRISIARNPVYHARYSIAKFAFSLALGAGIATAILLVAGDRDRVVLPGMILAGSAFVGSWVKP